MDIVMRQQDGAVIIYLKGRLDAITSSQFDSYVSTIFENINKLVIINLSGLEYISSAGLRSMLAFAKQLKSKDAKIVFAELKGSVKDVFRISGFYTIFEIVENESDAIKLTV
ncbi:MAG: STAS domain-containing protein [Thermodesulfovibrionales bacterium]|nr:STAS domain-containing protein [Thermodesulfovibrionales bacterium]